jgi:hypothetical protein
VGLLALSLPLSAVRMPNVKANMNAAATAIMSLVIMEPHTFTFAGQHVRIGAAAAVRAAITGNEVWRHGAMKPAGKVRCKHAD